MTGKVISRFFALRNLSNLDIGENLVIDDYLVYL
jgi:hypothetical protein